MMGVNQSIQQTSISNAQHGITVVNPTPGQEINEETEILPRRLLPILSIEGHIIDPKRHGNQVQLDQQLWMDFVTIVDKFSNSRADLIATRQSQIQEKILLVDDLVQRFTDSYVNDTHKALAKLNDDCRKLDEIQKLLNKCTVQSELCVDMLNKLNFLLPEKHKLETIEI